MYVKNQLKLKVIEEMRNFQFQEGVCYRSTSSSNGNNKCLLQAINKFVSLSHGSHGRHILIMGDFNYPQIDYERMAVLTGIDSEAKNFFEIIQDNYLFQHILENTRYRGEQTPSKLDCMFTDEDNVVENVEYETPRGKSDHVGITFDYLGGVKQSVKEIP